MHMVSKRSGSGACASATHIQTFDIWPSSVKQTKTTLL